MWQARQEARDFGDMSQKHIDIDAAMCHIAVELTYSEIQNLCFLCILNQFGF